MIVSGGKPAVTIALLGTIVLTSPAVAAASSRFDFVCKGNEQKRTRGTVSEAVMMGWSGSGASLAEGTCRREYFSGFPAQRF